MGMVMVRVSLKKINLSQRNVPKSDGNMTVCVRVCISVMYTTNQTPTLLCP